MDTVIFYGISNCDTTKKVLYWFKQNNTKVQFHDYKKIGITKEKISNWCKLVGWEAILNKRSTTWRELGEEEQKKITTQASAIKLMLAKNSIIKRPVIEYDEKILVGFDEKIYQQKFKK